MESEVPESSAGSSYEVALRELRDAVELREAEHARRNRDRVLFSRAVVLYFLGICFGLVVLGRGIDTRVYRDHLLARLRTGLPSLLHKLPEARDDLTPVYAREIASSLPAVDRKLDAAISAERSRLAGAIVPLAAGDLASIGGSAHEALARQLLQRFGTALHHDPRQALVVAQALHAEEFKQIRAGVRWPAGAAVARLDEIAESLRDLATPGQDAPRQSELARALTAAALQRAETKVLTGDIGPASTSLPAPKGGR